MKAQNMPSQQPTLPACIRERLGDRIPQPDRVGMSGASVWIYSDMVLKIQRAGTEAAREWEMLKWLRGRLPVPEVLAYTVENGVSYLLMSRLPGVMACDPYYMEKPELLTDLLARALEMLWAVDPWDCPRDCRLHMQLREARLRVEAGLVTMEDAEPETYGASGFRDPEDLLLWLEQNPPEERPLLSHGDFCLPNLFLEGDRITGFLDLGRCGVADPWRDIALGWRSLLHNAEGVYDGRRYPGFHQEDLFRVLGISPDPERLRYYILLDELF